MPLSAGTRLGPYEILSAIGAGGMGEVYKACDTRLGRDVAIKVLPSAFSSDPDRLHRFEQEARAAAALNHPNILAVYDIGSHDGSPYIVSELLEGETLRKRLNAGALLIRKSVEFAIQIAHGLAAAHERGIVHRDLKPENLFITAGGRAKILDFGLAKLREVEPAQAGLSALPTTPPETLPGALLGTIGYMAPEQVRGLQADHRSDIFAFGAVLHEILSGERAFTGDSPIETLSAILRNEPPELRTGRRAVPVELDRLVRHCLEKSPNQRFQSAQDLAFALEAPVGTSAAAPDESVHPIRPTRVRRAAMLLAVGVALMAIVTPFAIGRIIPRSDGTTTTELGVVFKRITFRRGNTTVARFTPDGQSVVYSAAWDGRSAEVFLARPDTPESRPLGIVNADLLDVSPSSELAVKLKTQYFSVPGQTGTLARVPLTGGTPRELREDVRIAAWVPNGTDLAVIRSADGRDQIEFPIGNVVYEAAELLPYLRVSPDGNLVAFAAKEGARWLLSVVNRERKPTRLATGLISVRGFAWDRSGQDIWVASTDQSGRDAISRISLSGKVRRATSAAANLYVHDVAQDGRVLVELFLSRAGLDCLIASERQVRDLSFLDRSIAADLSADGRNLLFGEFGQGGGATTSVYMRRTDGSAPVRLGDGLPLALSPDGRWAAALGGTNGHEILLLPTGAGETRSIGLGNLQPLDAVWFPNGKLLVFAAESGQRVRAYVHELDGTAPRPVTPEGLLPIFPPRSAAARSYSPYSAGISPDGTLLAARGLDRRIWLYPLDGGTPRLVTSLGSEDSPIQWNDDGRTLWATRPGELPATIFQVDLASGAKSLWKTLVPADNVGVISNERLLVSRDGRSYAHSYLRALTSDLYVVDGLR